MLPRKTHMYNYMILCVNEYMCVNMVQILCVCSWCESGTVCECACGGCDSGR